jgi:hypothetical protein
MTAALRRARHLVVASAAVAAVLVLAPSPALAQQSKSATLAAELAKLLEARKLDSIAARGGAPDEYVGALFFPGSQLLVVGAKYSSPDRMTLLLGAKQYRDVYIDLNSASVPQSKVFVSDLGANGLQFDRENNQPWDTVDVGGKSYAFDGDWGRAKISREEYTKVYQSSDEQYSKMLEALVAELKKTS